MMKRDKELSMPPTPARKGRILKSSDGKHYSVYCGCNSVYVKEYGKPKPKRAFKRHLRNEVGWTKTKQVGWACKHCSKTAEALAEPLEVPRKRAAPWHKAAYA